MSNPFEGKTTKQLKELVQDGVECEDCEGRGSVLELMYVTDPDWQEWYLDECPTCNGTGHTPLTNADLDALAACWCEGLIVDTSHVRRSRNPCKGNHEPWKDIPAYTTSPDAAMRLQVKYRLDTDWYYYPFCKVRGVASEVGEKRDALCHAITTAALIAALTEAMK